MFQFSCRFAFLSTLWISNRTPKITRILTLCQANAATLTLFSKGDKILITNLYECKGCNACQFIAEFLNKGWTKNSINRLLVKFGTVDRRPDSSRCSAHTDENVDTVESLLLSQEDKPQSHWTVREISREVGGSVDHQFRRLFTKICVSRKGALSRLTEAHRMHALFSVCSLRDDNVITSKPTWKLKHANSILETF